MRSIFKTSIDVSFQISHFFEAAFDSGERFSKFKDRENKTTNLLCCSPGRGVHCVVLLACGHYGSPFIAEFGVLRPVSKGETSANESPYFQNTFNKVFAFLFIRLEARLGVWFALNHILFERTQLLGDLDDVFFPEAVWGIGNVFAGLM